MGETWHLPQVHLLRPRLKRLSFCVWQRSQYGSNWPFSPLNQFSLFLLSHTTTCTTSTTTRSSQRWMAIVGSTGSGGIPLEEYRKDVPPGWDPTHAATYPLKVYMDKVRMWYRLWDGPDESVGPMLAGRLRGRAQSIALQIRLPTPNGDIDVGDAALIRLSVDEVRDPTTGEILQHPQPSGVQALMTALRSAFGEAEQLQATKSLEVFFEFKRGRLSLAEWSVQWQLNYEEAATHAGLEINDVAKTYLYFKSSNLSQKAIDDLLLQVHGDMRRFQEVRTLLLRMAHRSLDHGGASNMYEENKQYFLDEDFESSWSGESWMDAGSWNEHYMPDELYAWYENDWNDGAWDNNYYQDEAEDWNEQAWYESGWNENGEDEVETAETTADESQDFYKGKSKGGRPSAMGLGCSTCGSKWHNTHSCPLGGEQRFGKGKGQGKSKRLWQGANFLERDLARKATARRDPIFLARAMAREAFGLRRCHQHFLTTMEDPTCWTPRNRWSRTRSTSCRMWPPRRQRMSPASLLRTHLSRRSSWARRCDLMTNRLNKLMEMELKPCRSRNWTSQRCSPTPWMPFMWFEAKGFLVCWWTQEQPVDLWELTLWESWCKQFHLALKRQSNGSHHQPRSQASLVNPMPLWLASPSPSRWTMAALETTCLPSTLQTCWEALDRIAQLYFQIRAWDRWEPWSWHSGLKMVMECWFAARMGIDQTVLRPIWSSWRSCWQSLDTTSCRSARKTRTWPSRRKTTFFVSGKSPTKRRHLSRINMKLKDKIYSMEPKINRSPTRARRFSQNCSSQLRPTGLPAKMLWNNLLIYCQINGKWLMMNRRSRCFLETPMTRSTWKASVPTKVIDSQDIFQIIDFATCRRCTRLSQRSSTAAPRRHRWLHTMPDPGCENVAKGIFHFWEWCSGSGRLSLLALLSGLCVLFPIDYRYGWDLGHPDHQRIIGELEMDMDGGPDTLLYSPSCRPWSIASTKRDLQQTQQERASEMPTINFIRKKFKERSKRKKGNIVEQPWTSALWEELHDLPRWTIPHWPMQVQSTRWTAESDFETNRIPCRHLPQALHRKMQWSPRQKTWLVAGSLSGQQSHNFGSGVSWRTLSCSHTRLQELHQQQVQDHRVLLQVWTLRHGESCNSRHGTQLSARWMQIWKMAWGRRSTREETLGERGARKGRHLRDLSSRSFEEWEGDAREIGCSPITGFRQWADCRPQDVPHQVALRERHQIRGPWEEEEGRSKLCALVGGSYSLELDAANLQGLHQDQRSHGMPPTLVEAFGNTCANWRSSTSSTLGLRQHWQLEASWDRGPQGAQFQPVEWTSQHRRRLADCHLWHWPWRQGIIVIFGIKTYGSTTTRFGRCWKRRIWTILGTWWSPTTRTNSCRRRRTRSSCQKPCKPQTCVWFPQDFSSSTSLGTERRHGDDQEAAFGASWKDVALHPWRPEKCSSTMWHASWSLATCQRCSGFMCHMSQIGTLLQTSTESWSPAEHPLQRCGPGGSLSLRRPMVSPCDWRGHPLQGGYTMWEPRPDSHPQCLDEGMDQVLWSYEDTGLRSGDCSHDCGSWCGTTTTEHWTTTSWHYWWSPRPKTHHHWTCGETHRLGQAHNGQGTSRSWSLGHRDLWRRTSCWSFDGSEHHPEHWWLHTCHHGVWSFATRLPWPWGWPSHWGWEHRGGGVSLREIIETSADCLTGISGIHFGVENLKGQSVSTIQASPGTDAAWHHQSGDLQRWLWRTRMERTCHHLEGEWTCRNSHCGVPRQTIPHWTAPHQTSTWSILPLPQHREQDRCFNQNTTGFGEDEDSCGGGHALSTLHDGPSPQDQGWRKLHGFIPKELQLHGREHAEGCQGIHQAPLRQLHLPWTSIWKRNENSDGPTVFQGHPHHMDWRTIWDSCDGAQQWRTHSLERAHQLHLGEGLSPLHLWLHQPPHWGEYHTSEDLQKDYHINHQGHWHGRPTSWCFGLF